MAYSLTVLLDTVYHSKHSTVLIMASLQWKTCVLQGNFCSPQSKTAGHLRALLFFFLKQLSGLCFPDFQTYIKWWEKKCMQDFVLNSCRLPVGQASRKVERRWWQKRWNKNSRMTVWYASMFHAHYGKKSWRADGNMKWRCFCESRRTYSFKCSPRQRLSSFHTVGK